MQQQKQQYSPHNNGHLPSNMTKHKINMSTDISNQHGQITQQVGHNKHISMNGLPYEKMKGLTPMSNKSNNLGKNSMHL